jgi:hypothetical protein
MAIHVYIAMCYKGIHQPLLALDAVNGAGDNYISGIVSGMHNLK